jgi:hypothetical protein
VVEAIVVEAIMVEATAVGPALQHPPESGHRGGIAFEVALGGPEKILFRDRRRRPFPGASASSRPAWRSLEWKFFAHLLSRAIGTHLFVRVWPIANSGGEPIMRARMLFVHA